MQSVCSAIPCTVLSFKSALFYRHPRRCVQAEAHCVGPLERALLDADPGIFRCQAAGAPERFCKYCRTIVLTST